MNNTSNRDIFSHFMDEIYHSNSFLNDLTHLVRVHGSRTDEIEETAVHNMQCEDINQCAFSSRHQTQTQSKTEESLEAKLAFYRDLMDSLHFYVFHMYDCGLRTAKTESESEEEMSEEKKEEFDSQYFDKVFHRINKRIRQRESVLKQSFQRFQTNKNSKFTLGATEQNNATEDDTTYLDAILQYLLSQKKHKINKSEIDTFVAICRKM